MIHVDSHTFGQCTEGETLKEGSEQVEQEENGNVRCLSEVLVFGDDGKLVQFKVDSIKPVEKLDQTCHVQTDAG